jgi:hypothetical protein
MSNIKEVKFTKTATFLFPLLNIPKKFFKCDIRDPWGRMKYSTRFLNAYLKHEEITKYSDSNHVFLILRNYRDPEFENFYSSLCKLSNYVDDYDSGSCLIAVFKVPEFLQDDFNMIKEGLYSKVSQKAKELILSNHYFSHESSTIPMILYKSEALRREWEKRLSNEHKECPSIVDLRDQEVWAILNIQKETLTKTILDSYKEKKQLQVSGEF